jgi:hypothetical protein
MQASDTRCHTDAHRRREEKVAIAADQYLPSGLGQEIYVTGRFNPMSHPSYHSNLSS